MKQANEKEEFVNAQIKKGVLGKLRTILGQDIADSGGKVIYLNETLERLCDNEIEKRGIKIPLEQ